MERFTDGGTYFTWELPGQSLRSSRPVTSLFARHVVPFHCRAADSRAVGGEQKSCQSAVEQKQRRAPRKASSYFYLTCLFNAVFKLLPLQHLC